MEGLLTVAQAADRAEVSKATMSRAAKKGIIKAEKLGRDWFIYESNIERWKAEVYRPNKAIRFPRKEDPTDS